MGWKLQLCVLVIDVYLSIKSSHFGFSRVINSGLSPLETATPILKLPLIDVTLTSYISTLVVMEPSIILIFFVWISACLMRKVLISWAEAYELPAPVSSRALVFFLLTVTRTRGYTTSSLSCWWAVNNPSDLWAGVLWSLLQIDMWCFLLHFWQAILLGQLSALLGPVQLKHNLFWSRIDRLSASLTTLAQLKDSCSAASQYTQDGLLAPFFCCVLYTWNGGFSLSVITLVCFIMLISVIWFTDRISLSPEC